ncbi:PepSY domain-containing protein [Shewanella goraebulensis]|uniref:PepSY domain-containing protein n=1 Tax=Shewanella goraebulensis TaxID=3050637 RepID=UPI00254BC750|nr:PepSY domain-containing protein [Shewanella goraebulensis]
MKAKTRLLWMKLHGYIACFFLPITLIYIITGMLYFFDIKGEVSKDIEYFVPTTEGWPDNEQSAKKFVVNFLKGKSHLPLPEDYYWEGVHDWYGHRQEVILAKTDDPNTLEIHIKEHDFLMQLLIIHKGFAGSFFKVFSILFGISLAFSIISGVVITLQLPQLKVPSLISIAAGALALSVGFIL